MVLCLDEAQELARDALGDLFRCAQKLVQEKAPFLLIVAGTPQLWPQEIRGAGATFGERCRKLRIGPLSPEEAEAALVRPLDGTGIAFDPVVLGRVLEDTRNYPYFIQELGSELFTSSRRLDSTVFDEQVYRDAFAAFEEEKRQFYGDRADELYRLKMTRQSHALAEFMLDERNTSFTVKALRNALANRLQISEEEAMEAISTIEHTGLIWRHDGVEYAAGIPSLLNFVLEQFQ